jgi:hypothetical protein
MGHNARPSEEGGKVVVFGPPGDRIREALTQGFAKAFLILAWSFRAREVESCHEG